MINVLKTVKSDTSRAILLNTVCFKLYEAADYSRSLQYSDEAIHFFDKMISQSREEKYVSFYTKCKVNCLNNIGAIYRQQGKYDEAIQQHTAALKLADLSPDKEGAGSCYNYLATIYNRQGNFPEALKNYLGALKILLTTDNKKGIASCYNNVGLIYGNQDNFTEAIKNFTESIRIKEEIGDKRGLGNSYQNIGETYSRQGNNTEAIKYFESSLKCRKEAGDKDGMSKSYIGLGILYQRQGNCNEAMTTLLAALKIREEIGNKDGIAGSLRGLSEVYRAQQKYDDAINSLNKAVQLAKEIGAKNEIKECYQALSNIYRDKGDYENALGFHTRYTELKDSIFNEEKSKQINELSARYDSEKKEKDIQNLEHEKSLGALKLQNEQQSLLRSKLENHLNQQKIELLASEKQLQQSQIDRNKTELSAQEATIRNNQDKLELLAKDSAIQNIEIKKQTLLRNSLLGGLALALVLFFFIYRNYRTSQKLKLENIRNNIAADLHDDIGSTLNSISLFSEVAKKEAGKEIPALEQIGVSSRKIIDAMSDIVWTINPEQDSFENVITRMRSLAYLLLKAKEIEFSFKADERLNALSLPMLVRKNVYLLFKEATNNIVKYSRATYVTFQLSLENKNVKMLIRDNGAGFDTTIAPMGNGLKNMKKRAGEIGGQLLIESTETKGVNIELSFKI